MHAHVVLIYTIPFGFEGFYTVGAFQFHEFLPPLYITLLLDFY